MKKSEKIYDIDKRLNELNDQIRRENKYFQRTRQQLEKIAGFTKKKKKST